MMSSTRIRYKKIQDIHPTSLYYGYYDKITTKLNLFKLLSANSITQHSRIKLNSKKRNSKQIYIKTKTQIQTTNTKHKQDPNVIFVKTHSEDREIENTQYCKTHSTNS